MTKHLNITDIGRTNMEREDRIKELAMRISNCLLGCDYFTYEDMAGAIAYLVGVIDIRSEKANNTKSGTFAEYVYSMIGDVYKVSSEKPAWRPSTEHPLVDEEVIALIGEYNQIGFAHIVDKNIAIDYDGWNIPDVKCWIPCPKIGD